jgi:class 3 adenylate cyclase
MMFLDIRDFTVLADSRAPGEVANLQNTLFGEFINIIKDNRGIVIQILGDGLYASFGAPIVNDTHISDAVKAGYDMIKKTEELITNGKIPYIKLGIGIHSGNVIAGEIGNEYRKSYSLAGSNVIIASRIEQLNKELNSQFLISKIVFDNLKDELNSYTYKGESKLKGISKPVGVYQLI